MMKANELRIGNLIQHNGRSFAVDTIDSSVLNGVEPIPLTKDWMDRFGFDEDGCVPINNPNTLQVTKSLDVIVYEESNDFICLGGVAFVHQLQNIYFALTGEELTVKTKD